MRRLLRISVRATLLLALLVLLAARVHAAERAKLTIGYSTTGPTAVGLWMAKEIGAFGKYGVEPNLVFISSSPVMVPALIGGDVQCAIAGANAVIAAVLGGAPIVSVASLANRPYLRLWV
ncbi:MAG TPA: ABC transporter substrate-binding protein, partial [Candidatus Limnocylindrales bacterium]|nr:ABC transporter substrate-binding protein [Candidatus Limnocylindrales bacterium]